jgi:hypothetical protein
VLVCLPTLAGGERAAPLNASPIHAFGPRWTIRMPPQIDGTADVIIVRQYADQPSPVADGWLGLCFIHGQVPPSRPLEHQQARSDHVGKEHRRRAHPRGE